MQKPGTTRREAIAGGIALTLASSYATAGRADADEASTPPGRKMIVRADDIGLSTVCNIGTFEAIDHGVVTAADVMLDSPGTDDALHRLRNYPWISIGWHMHMWGAPVLAPAHVSSLVERSGDFAGRFRTDLAGAIDVDFDEAIAELRAQLARCKRILGRFPDTGNPGSADTPWARATRRIYDEFGIAYGFSANPASDPAYTRKIAAAQAAGEPWAKFYSVQPTPAQPAGPKWAARKIVGAAGPSAFSDLLTDSISKVERDYDPVRFYTEDRAGILRQPPDVITWQAWHPGYIDYYVYRLGERVNRVRAQQFVVGRTQDVAALCDPRLRAWIKRNRIELINFRDALYGSREYQDHLRMNRSELAV